MKEILFGMAVASAAMLFVANLFVQFKKGEQLANEVMDKIAPKNENDDDDKDPDPDPDLGDEGFSKSFDCSP